MIETEADLKNRIADLELELTQLKDVLPQAFAALDLLANVVKNSYINSCSILEERDFKMAERTLKWLDQFKAPSAPTPNV